MTSTDPSNATIPSLPPEIAQEALEATVLLINAGFDDFEEVVECVSDSVSDPSAISEEQAEVIVAPLWNKRLAEQETWPKTTDCDRLDAAFEALSDAGITAEQNFTCCMSCGVAEIRGEAADGDHGWVFYHEQDTESAIGGNGLMLAFGAYSRSEEDAVAVAEQCVEALRQAGLNAHWTGRVDQRLYVEPLDWRRRIDPV